GFYGAVYGGPGPALWVWGCGFYGAVYGGPGPALWGRGVRRVRKAMVVGAIWRTRRLMLVRFSAQADAAVKKNRTKRKARASSRKAAAACRGGSASARQCNASSSGAASHSRCQLGRANSEASTWAPTSRQ